MRLPFDVAVVGAGPAGAWAARGLAAAGARTALIDPSHPREKPCGGGVTGRALALVGASVADVASGVAIETASFSYGGRSVAMAIGSSGDARLTVVPRASFDAWLVDRAAAAGAVLVRSRATDLEREGEGWRITTRDGDIHARWVIGADGPGSLVRRRVAAPFARADLSIAAGYYVDGPSSRQIDIALEDHPPGYLWLFPRRDHLAVGACAQADATTTDAMLAQCRVWIDRHAPGAPRRRYSWPIPSLRAAAIRQEAPAGPGWLLAGDAAGLVDPITREGIFFALSSGAAAAAAIAGGGDPARRYLEAVRDTIYAELALAADLKARFYRPHFMGLLVRALERSARIRGVMSDLVAGEQPYGTLKRRLLRTFEWKLMLELFGLHRGPGRP
jgi:geranylgeranyl reductase family protein